MKHEVNNTGYESSNQKEQIKEQSTWRTENSNEQLYLNKIQQNESNFASNMKLTGFWSIHPRSLHAYITLRKEPLGHTCSHDKNLSFLANSCKPQMPEMLAEVVTVLKGNICRSPSQSAKLLTPTQ
jgi:hypothetical protein